MAGQPKRKAVTEELQRRARELDDSATMLDYVAHWQAEGETLLSLAADLTRALHIDITREFVRRTLISAHGEDTVTVVLSRARLIGAGAIVEDARRILDDVPEDRDSIAKAKLQADFRARMASWWNREEYGEQRALAMQLNIGTLHIDAMRKVAIDNPSRATARIAQAEEAQDVRLLPTNNDTA